MPSEENLLCPVCRHGMKKEKLPLVLPSWGLFGRIRALFKFRERLVCQNCEYIVWGGIGSKLEPLSSKLGNKFTSIEETFKHLTEAVNLRVQDFSQVVRRKTETIIWYYALLSYMLVIAFYLLSAYMQAITLYHFILLLGGTIAFEYLRRMRRHPEYHRRLQSN
jgi:hypothetical protein